MRRDTTDLPVPWAKRLGLAACVSEGFVRAVRAGETQTAEVGRLASACCRLHGVPRCCALPPADRGVYEGGPLGRRGKMTDLADQPQVDALAGSSSPRKLRLVWHVGSKHPAPVPRQPRDGNVIVTACRVALQLLARRHRPSADLRLR